MNAEDAAQEVLRAMQRGDEVVSITSLQDGQRAIIDRSGNILGSFGDDELLRNLAADTFRTRVSSRSDDLFAELHAPPETLMIFGAGHISVPLAELGTKLGFSVLVLDDREEFADEARFPAQARVQKLDLSEPLRDVRIDENTYVVLVTRAHEHDFNCLLAILFGQQQPRYIGLIGSTRRIRAAFKALLDAQIPKDMLYQISAPVGLDIGAETPAEIAVSIAAEIIQVRRGGDADTMAASERVVERFFAEHK